jgi:NitT/TauT family transport system substrate-binding protein
MAYGLLNIGLMRRAKPAFLGSVSHMQKTSLFAALAAAALIAGTPAPGAAQTAVKFALDWKFEGPAAPYFVALDKGYYKAEGLDVTIDSGPGSVAGIARVAAGTYPLGFFDINSLVKFQDQNPDKKVQAVLMVYDKPPFAIASLKKTGITGPKGLEGKVLGAPAPDGAYAQWKAFVQENKIDASKVKIENVGFPVREPMLADGKVDAITGFSFSMHFNLMQKGIKPEDIVTMLMADHGLVLYGNAVMVNPDYAKANPKAVAGFVKATIKGIIDTIKDPDSAIKSVMKRNETGDEKVELARLKMSLRDNFVTPWVKENGVGGVDMTRLAKSIDQIALTYDFKARPKAEDIFTSQFLPPAAERKF